MRVRHFYTNTLGEKYIPAFLQVSFSLDPIIMKVLSRYREDPTRQGLGFPEVLRERDIFDNNKSGDTHLERGREGGRIEGVGIGGTMGAKEKRWTKEQTYN
jgi:hypothetical protein